MKTRKNELDVDFIGGEGALTKDQEKEISDFIAHRKATIHLESSKTQSKLATKSPNRKVKV
jgi:hypothetical protein